MKKKLAILVATLTLGACAMGLTGCGKTENNKNDGSVDRQTIATACRNAGDQMIGVTGFTYSPAPTSATRNKAMKIGVDAILATEDEEKQTTGMLVNVISCGRLTKMVGEFYENAAYPVDGSAVKFTYQMPMYDPSAQDMVMADYDVAIQTYASQQDNLVEIELYLGGMQYSLLEINYNFSSETVEAFRILTAQNAGEFWQVQENVYKDNVCSIIQSTNNTSVINAVIAKETAFEAQVANITKTTNEDILGAFDNYYKETQTMVTAYFAWYDSHQPQQV